MQSHKKHSILFLLSHQPNPRFIKQIKYLSKNNRVNVVYFNRKNIKTLNDEYMQDINLDYNLGDIPDESIIGRGFVYMRSINKLQKIIKDIDYDILLVNNIDILFLYMFVSKFFLKPKKAEIIMEISDLRFHVYSKNIKSRIIRAIEKVLFRQVDKLIVTSIKFYDLYYKNLFSKKPFLLENKPLSSMVPKKLTTQDKNKNEKIIIGIVGSLEQGNPYKTLFDVVKDKSEIEVHIYGRGVYADLVQYYSKIYKNIKYFGEYNFFQNSAKIYSSLDVLYMPYDTTNGSLNNKVALPNKLYEAMYFQVPIITSKGTYTGEIVERLGIGTTIKCCNKKDLIRLISTLHSKLSGIKQKFMELDSDMYLADNDYINLEKFIYNNEK